VFSLSVFFVIL